MKNILSIQRKCKNETIVYTKFDGTHVIKKYFSQDGELKKSCTQCVLDKSLIRRRARDTDDFMLNMVENFGYEIIHENSN